jgi:hypothetical protein
VLGSNQRRLSRRFYGPLSFYPSRRPLTSAYALVGCFQADCSARSEIPGRPRLPRTAARVATDGPERERLRAPSIHDPPGSNGGGLIYANGPDLLTNTAGNTVSDIDPLRRVDLNLGRVGLEPTTGGL